jgi:hypothetical protein
LIINIKKKLKEIPMKLLKELLEATRTLAPQDLFQELCSDFGMFISFNLGKVQQYAVDPPAAKKLEEMQKQFKAPAVNGKTFFDIIQDRDMMSSPTGRGAILKWIYGMIQYIEPRMNTLVNEKGKQLFIPRFEAIKDKYKHLVSKQ